MFAWLSENLATILITLGLAAVVVLIIRSMLRDKRKGEILLRRQLRVLSDEWCVPCAHGTSGQSLLTKFSVSGGG